MIGRINEIQQLNGCYFSGQAELVVIHGRTRTGKTYLVDEVFRSRITFRHTGLSPAERENTGLLKAQLEHFYYSLLLHGMEKGKKPMSWLEAFHMLEKLLESKDDGGRQVVFLDEMAWLDSPRSGFLTAFEGFWNTWGCHRENLMVVVCSEADLWTEEKLLNNTSGLYGRVTLDIKLKPFTLAESEEFLKSKEIALSRFETVQFHMMLGGNPYYLNCIKSGLSFAQNVNELFFTEGARLKGEYDRLLSAVFGNAEPIKRILSVLATENAGFTRGELARRIKLKDGKKLSEYLNALVAGDFVGKYVPYGENGNAVHYKLIDPFCNFYLGLVNDKKVTKENHWQRAASTEEVAKWREKAFENVCFNHIGQIKKALGISGVETALHIWTKRYESDTGERSVMLISRDDSIINMCEIRFRNDDITVDRGFYRLVMRRQEMLEKTADPKTVVKPALITVFGVVDNEYRSIFSDVLTLEDLFA